MEGKGKTTLLCIEQNVYAAFVGWEIEIPYYLNNKIIMQQQEH